MKSELLRLNENEAINLANVSYIKKEAGDNLTIHFVGETQPKTFYCSSKEGKEFIQWLKNTDPSADKVTYFPSPWS